MAGEGRALVQGGLKSKIGGIEDWIPDQVRDDGLMAVS